MKTINALFHILGLSALGSAVYLEITTFIYIFMNGYFCAVEPNIYILSSEIVMTLYGMIYLIYLFYRFYKKASETRIDSDKNANS